MISCFNLAKAAVFFFFLFCLPLQLPAADKLVSCEYDYGAGEIRVKVSTDDDGAYLSCAFFTQNGREVQQDRFVSGNAEEVYPVPVNSDSCEIGLWAKRYPRGAGPGTQDAFAIHGDYYLYNYIDGRTIPVTPSTTASDNYF